MEGKRFVFGLVAGVLLGLGVIVASAGLGTGSLYGSLGTGGTYFSAPTATSSTVTSAATITSSQSSYPAGGIVPPNQKNETFTVETSTTQGSNAFGNSSANSASVQSSLSSLSSNVNTLPHQPLLSNAVIFLPVFVAFLLGAALYRASRLPDEEEN